MKVFPIPLHDSNGTTMQYDRLTISPDGRIFAVTNGSTLQWLSAETGQVLDTADRAHDGNLIFSLFFLLHPSLLQWPVGPTSDSPDNG